MKVALYPGSFNPFHAGHREVVDKALQVFDRVIVAKCINPEKMNEQVHPAWQAKLPARAMLMEFNGLVVDLASKVEACAIVKGLRDFKDLEDERKQQYWNEGELGLVIPTFYVLASPNLVHMSSTAIRTLQKFKKGV